MGYEIFRSGQFQYAVHWDTVYQIIRRYRRAEAKLDGLRVVRSSEPGLAGLVLPAIESVEIDWEDVQRVANERADQDYEDLVRQSERNMGGVYESLGYMQRQTTRFTGQVARRMTEVGRSNQQRVEAHVAGWEGATTVATFLRDASVEGLVIGSTLLTGGAAGAALGTASVLKGYGKFEDTGNVGAAVVTGVGTLMFGAVKMGGRKLDNAEEVALAVIYGQWEALSALAEGKSFGEALEKGSAKVVGLGIDKLTKVSTLKKILEKAPVPFTISADGEKDFARKVVSKGLQKLEEKKAGAVVAWALAAKGQSLASDTGHAPRSGPMAGRGTGAMIDSATFADQALLNLAVVNMNFGIGNFR